MTRTVTIAPLSLALLIGCHSPTPAAQQEQPPVQAQVLTLSSKSVDRGLTVSGVVHARLEADISAQVTAPIAAVTKREGDRVRQGEVLVRLHAPALSAGVTQANASVSAAEQQTSAAQIQAKLAADTLARYQQLRARHSVTPHELEQIQAQSAAAEAQQKTAAAQVAVAREALAVQRAHAADAVIIAPFTGVVTQRMADPGALAVPGVPILHLQSTGPMQVQFSVPDAAISSIHAGEQVEVSDGSGTSGERATVTAVSPAGDTLAHTFQVKAVLPPGREWNAGAVVNVALPVANAESALFIPLSAVIEQGGLTGVLVVRGDSRAEVRYISLGAKGTQGVQVLTGLNPGDRILVHGDLALAGRRIEVTP